MFSNKIGLRVLLALAIAMVGLCLDIQDAYAQAASCSRLQSALRQLDRNADFRGMQGNSQAAQQLQQRLQNAESTYVRNGCNDDARAGRTLTRECQGVAREVLRLRQDLANVSGAVDTANAVAQQRESILQELARFGCGTDGSSATFTNDRQSIFDRVFGTSNEADFSNGQMVGGEGYWDGRGYSTVRTLCVRLSDGYFWPISYATLTDYLVNDANQCHQACPNTPVDLYYYDNPGQEPEQMRNLYGEPYTALPNAFRYREKIDSIGACRATEPAPGGSIETVTMADGQARSIVELTDAEFPLPLRDPRGYRPIAVAVAPAPAATFLDIPLPRRRPAGPGETAPPRPVESASATDLRLVQFGNRTVRVVGPDTPYAEAVAAAPTQAPEPSR